MMLIVLGALIATLVVIALAPAYRRRVERLTSDRIRQSVPITEAEIRADKDRLRAQYAIRVHKLEAQAEQQKLSVARQRIEMNQRDARIAELDGELERYKESLEDNINARRVLEHIVTDRMPRLEHQLDTARQLISTRDQEMSGMKSEATRSVRALDEAMQLNAQQRSELDRLSASLTHRGAYAGRGSADTFEGELALRTELEALRSKSREQAQLIDKLQSAASRATQRGGETGSPESTPDMAQIARLRRELAEARAEVTRLSDINAAPGSDQSPIGAHVATLQAKIDSQSSEITKLKAELGALNAGEAEPSGGRAPESRLAARARIVALEAKITSQDQTIQKLRADLTASNERMARQAAQFMGEMRRLGSGTVPTTLEPRRQNKPVRQDDLTDRSPGSDKQSTGRNTEAPPSGSERRARERSETGAASAKVANYIKALSDDTTFGEADAATWEAAPAGKQMATAEITQIPRGSDGAAEDDGRGKRRLKLLDRISKLDKA